MSKYNERPKGDTRPVPADQKEKIHGGAADEKLKIPGSQDARRHEADQKHGKR